MKIEPKHNYKKPLYAVGAAVLIGSTAILGTGCVEPTIAGGMTVAETTEPYYAGDIQVVEPEIDGMLTIDEGDDEPESTICEAIEKAIEEE